MVDQPTTQQAEQLGELASHATADSGPSTHGGRGLYLTDLLREEGWELTPPKPEHYVRVNDYTAIVMNRDGQFCVEFHIDRYPDAVNAAHVAAARLNEEETP